MPEDRVIHFAFSVEQDISVSNFELQHICTSHNVSKFPVLLFVLTLPILSSELNNPAKSASLYKLNCKCFIIFGCMINPLCLVSFKYLTICLIATAFPPWFEPCKNLALWCTAKDILGVSSQLNITSFRLLTYSPNHLYNDPHLCIFCNGLVSA